MSPTYLNLIVRSVSQIVLIIWTILIILKLLVLIVIHAKYAQLNINIQTQIKFNVFHHVLIPNIFQSLEQIINLKRNAYNDVLTIILKIMIKNVILLNALKVKAKMEVNVKYALIILSKMSMDILFAKIVV